MVTEQQALTWMLEQGYDADQAKAFASTITGNKVAAVKHETVSMVLTELTAGMISQGDATTALTNLGYAADAIPFLLQYAQARATITARNSAVSRVRSGFLASVVTARPGHRLAVPGGGTASHHHPALSGLDGREVRTPHGPDHGRDRQAPERERHLHRRGIVALADERL